MFYKDLERGQGGERYIQKQLTYLGDLKQSNSKGYDLFNDTYKIEVKTDFMSKKSGNLAIEYIYKDDFSGIMTTESNLWVHIFHFKDKWYYLLIPTREFKSYLVDDSFTHKSGGDDNKSSMVMIPIQRIIDDFPLRITKINN